VDIIARLLRACAIGYGRFIALSNSSPIGDVRPNYGGDLLDNHDLATSYALQAPDFRKPVPCRKLSVQPEAGFASTPRTVGNLALHWPAKC
jgi:hypothetical protein